MLNHNSESSFYTLLEMWYKKSRGNGWAEGTSSTPWGTQWEDQEPGQVVASSTGVAALQSDWTSGYFVIAGMHVTFSGVTSLLVKWTCSYLLIQVYFCSRTR
jgi:hypothetical protein